MMDLHSKINSNKIFLKILNKKDVKLTYVEWLNNPKVNKYTDLVKKKHTIRSTKEFVNNVYLSRQNFLYGIFYKDKNKNVHIGNIKVGPIMYLHKTAFVGYVIGDQRFWNKNIGTIVIKKIKLICKRIHKLKKVNAGVSELNKASQRILIKNKFKLEGVFKNQIVYKKKRYSLHQYGCIL